MTAVLLALLLVLAGASQTQAASCREVHVTGYVKSEFGPRTADGTPIGTDEAIVAASWDIPLGWYVALDGLHGLFRVADRGRLGSDGWIDVAVNSRAEAYALTGQRHACVLSPDELGIGAP